MASWDSIQQKEADLQFEEAEEEAILGNDEDFGDDQLFEVEIEEFPEDDLLQDESETALVELASDEPETPVSEEDGGFPDAPADDVTESSARDDFEEDDDEEEEEESRLRGGRFRSERRTDEFKTRRSETIPDNLEMPTQGQASMMTSASQQHRPNFPRKRGRGKQFGARHHMQMGGRFMRPAGSAQAMQPYGFPPFQQFGGPPRMQMMHPPVGKPITIQPGMASPPRMSGQPRPFVVEPIPSQTQKIFVNPHYRGRRGAKAQTPLRAKPLEEAFGFEVPASSSASFESVQAPVEPPSQDQPQFFQQQLPQQPFAPNPNQPGFPNAFQPEVQTSQFQMAPRLQGQPVFQPAPAPHMMGGNQPPPNFQPQMQRPQGLMPRPPHATHFQGHVQGHQPLTQHGPHTHVQRRMRPPHFARGFRSQRPQRPPMFNPPRAPPANTPRVRPLIPSRAPTPAANRAQTQPQNQPKKFAQPQPRPPTPQTTTPVTSAPVPSQVKADALARKKMERARRFATGAPAVATTGVKRLPTDDASTDDNNPLTSLVSPPKMIKTTDVEQTKPVSVLMTSVPVDVRAGGDDAIASEYERKLEEQRRMREEVKRKKEERRLMRAHTLKEQPALTSTVTSLLRAPAAEASTVSSSNTPPPPTTSLITAATHQQESAVTSSSKTVQKPAQRVSPQPMQSLSQPRPQLANQPRATQQTSNVKKIKLTQKQARMLFGQSLAASSAGGSGAPHRVVRAPQHSARPSSAAVPGRQVVVRPTPATQTSIQKPCKVRITGLSTNTKTSTIYEMAAKSGTVKSFNMEDGQGCAFVTFKSEVEAKKFLATWDRKMLELSHIRVEVV